MKRYFFVAVLLAPLMSINAGAECIAEVAPKLPDGKTATVDDMKAAQKAIKTYMANSEAFLACLDKQNEGTTELQRQQTDVIYNATVKEMREIGARFNAEARKFNKRS